MERFIIVVVGTLIHHPWEPCRRLMTRPRMSLHKFLLVSTSQLNFLTMKLLLCCFMLQCQAVPTPPSPAYYRGCFELWPKPPKSLTSLVCQVRLAVRPSIEHKLLMLLPAASFRAAVGEIMIWFLNPRHRLNGIWSNQGIEFFLVLAVEKIP